jgi:hypothetical protein
MRGDNRQRISESKPKGFLVDQLKWAEGNKNG